ncbi:hypothetical protein GALMADRAFT_142100 [Galerina marginata CBS 339.88]|uniref:EF-hand domain-containing protein n=1 Tax=Galerina marginata (strain CBS 339.88) TaxID=685588 RepID=A0A067SU94_GALM3|nr:hypothetical protein GALMADRAFT_142100 [Galerina marginata CBS 339.88]
MSNFQDNPLSNPSTLENRQEQVWQDLNRFYATNEHAIENAGNLGTDYSELTIAINTFTETVNVVLDGLVALGNVHPVLGVAIFAFHSVISLDLTRRDNNRKVIAVKLQMQNMMCTMFQLRKIKHLHVEEAERDRQASQLQRLVKGIADDIIACGSDLNYYMDRKLVSKLINAKVYERRFADHIDTFTQRRSQLQSTITAYIAAGVDAANMAIANVGSKVAVVDTKLDAIAQAIFRKLDTPREHEVLTFLDKNGGAQKCINKDELLLILLSKAGETLQEKNSPVLIGEEMMQLRRTLGMELAGDLEETLAKNQTRFEKLLTVQNTNLERMSDQIEEQGQKMQDHRTKLEKIVNTSLLILEEGKIIKKAVVPFAPVKLKDAELQQIWDRMCLKRSVKAKTFVLTFRDHLIIDRSVPPTPRPAASSTLHPETSSLLLSSAVLAQAQTNPEDDRDLWVLKYIDAAHVHPIVEAMDEDGSGFISVQEANKFALARPAGLLQWIAYWAAGWHINLTDYRSKIYTILLQIYEALDFAHPANRAHLNSYFNHDAIRRVESLLRSTRPLSEHAPIDSRLTEIAKFIASVEEDRLLPNLKELSFTIKSAADVTLIAGSGRVEILILPLLYLLLNRHLEIVKLAQKVVLGAYELATHSRSIMSLFEVFDERMAHLEVIFRQIHTSAESQFVNHAYGMFLSSFRGNHSSSENILLSFKGTKTQSKFYSIPEQEGNLDLSILTQPLGESLQFEELPAPQEYVSHAVEGVWVGVCSEPAEEKLAYQGSFQLNIGPITDKRISGNGENWFQDITFEGQVDLPDPNSCTGPIEVSLRIMWPDSDWLDDIRCIGQYDPETDSIQGRWVVGQKSAVFPPARMDFEGDSDNPPGQFFMTKGNSDIFRFRHLLNDPTPSSPMLNLSRRRWAFAIETVLFQTQRRLGSSTFWHRRIEERKRWIELSCRNFLDIRQSVTKPYLSSEGRAELFRLREFLHPSIGKLFDDIAFYLFDRAVYYLGRFVCDVCDRDIVFTRYLCITCMEEDLSDQIDMCAECIDSRVFTRETRFVHHFSHSLIRSSRCIHYCELATMIPHARLRSERIKASFKASAARKQLSQGHEVKTTKNVGISKAWRDSDDAVRSRLTTLPLICACCRKELTLPCWACVTCVLDTLICIDCEHRGEPVPQPEGASSVHSRYHPLLRINHSEEINESELKPTRLEAQLLEMEARTSFGFDEGLLRLEQKINLQLEEMRATVDEVGKKIRQPVQGTTSTVNQTIAHNPLAPDEITEGIAERERKAEPSQDDRISALETKLHQRLDRLESRFELLMSLVQEIVSTTRSTSSAQLEHG